MKHYIDKDLQEAVDSLQRSVRIPSVRGDATPEAPFGTSVLAALNDVLDLGRRLGFQTGVFENQVGWIEYGNGDEMVAFLGHVDVVPAGEGWKHDPFGAEIEDGIIYGRGVLDDKGPVIAAIYALNALKSSGLDISKRIRILVGTNEENGCTAIKHYVSSKQELPVMGFTSDACYPLLNREKGTLHLHCEVPIENRDGNGFIEICGGTATNVVPPYCVATLNMKPSDLEKVIKEICNIERGSCSDFRWEKPGDDRIKIEAFGIPEHGSRPEKGLNAIMVLLNVLGSVTLPIPQKKIINYLNRVIGFETDGKSLGIKKNDIESGDLTLNLGTFCLSESKASFALDIRYPVSSDASEILSILSSSFEKEGISFHVLFDAPPLYIDPSSEVIQKLQAVYRKETGQEPELLSTGESTYAKTIPNLINFGPIFPEEDYTIHQADECWSIVSFKRNISMMAEAFYELAK